MKRSLFYLLCCLSIVPFAACGPQEPPKIAVTGISLDRVKVTMTEGESTTLVATVLPADAADKSVTWSSSNTATATVSESGVVNAVHAGTTVITAKTNDGGITATCSVTVDIAMAAITGEASHISCRNAIMTGKVNLPQATTSDLRIGILYSTDSSVLFDSSTAIDATTFDEQFNYSIVSEVLEPETTYYFRSYASQGGEVAYGDIKSFKTLAVRSLIQTLDVTEIDAGVATLNAMLDLTDCKYDGIEYGFKLTPQEGSENAFKASDLSNKTYSYKVETLIRDKQYYVVAYVTLDGRTYTAESKSFATQSLKASVTLNSAADITEFKARVSGTLKVESLGQFSKSAKLYYLDSEGTVEELLAGGTAKKLSLNTDGSFSFTLKNLISNKTYYYAVVATVDGASFSSEVSHFTTASIGVTVDANDVTGITETRGTLNGTLIVTSIENVSKTVWFYYSASAKTAEALKTQGTKETASLGSTGTFSKQITNLTDNTTYYYISCAKVNGEDYVSEVKSFTTATIGVNLTTNDVTDITEFKGMLHGKLTITSIDAINYEEWFYYSATATTAETLKLQGTKVSASVSPSLNCFIASIMGLTENTPYYYIACARVCNKDYFGEVKCFKTADFTANVTTRNASNVSFTTATLNGTLSVTSIEALTKEVWFLYSETATMIDAIKSNGTKVLSTLSGDTFSADISGLKDGTTYHCVACAKVHNRVLYSTVMSFDTPVYPRPTAVDMGLSVKWGSFNVGAFKPEEYGDYYAWGETTTKTVYNLSTYTLCKGSEYTMTKYCTNKFYGTVDNKKALEKSDDVAVQKLGGNWRMPTSSEWTELTDKKNCTWTDATVNGVKGYRVTSKTTGNSIFLPLAGWREEGTLYNRGIFAHYWSSSLNTGSPLCAYCGTFYNSTYECDDRPRYLGLPVRPVCD